MKQVFLLLLSCLTISVFAQRVTVSEELSIRNDKFYAIIGKMKGRLLLLREHSNKVEVQAFDEKLRKGWDKELKLDKKNPVVLEVIPGDEYFSLLYRYRHKGNSFVKLHRYDPAANLIDSLTVYDLGSSFMSRQLEVVYSENKRIAMVYRIDSPREFEVFAIDLQELELLWTSKFSPVDFNAYRDDFAPLLGNNGTAYFLFESDNRSGNIEEHQLTVYTLDPFSAGIQKRIILLDKFLTFDIQYTLDNLNRSIVVAGLYSEKNRGRATGHFFCKIPIDNPNQMVLSTEPFTDQFLSSLLQKDVTNNKGLADVEVREIVLRMDGGILLIVERSREYERRSTYTGRTYSGSTSGRFIVDYYHDDVFVVAIHPDGEVHWRNIMYKRQYSQDDDAVFSSFFLLKTPSNLRFLFNDEVKEENTVSEYVVSASGHMDRNAVMSTDDQNIRLRFRDALQTGANELIIPSERRNRLRLVRVQFN